MSWLKTKALLNISVATTFAVPEVLKVQGSGLLKELAPLKELEKFSTEETVQLDRGELNNLWFRKALLNDVGVKLKFTFTLAEPKGGELEDTKKLSAEPVKVPHPLKSGSVVVPKLSFLAKNKSIITLFWKVGTPAK